MSTQDGWEGSVLGDLGEAVQLGQLGGMQHLQHQAAIPAAELGVNHSISGSGLGVCPRNSSLGRAGEGFSHFDFCFTLQMYKLGVAGVRPVLGGGD